MVEWFPQFLSAGCHSQLSHTRTETLLHAILERLFSSNHIADLEREGREGEKRKREGLL